MKERTPTGNKIEASTKYQPLRFRTPDQRYCHVDSAGNPLYSERYDYVSNFENGVAVVQNFETALGGTQQTTEAFHIGNDGRPLYAERYVSANKFVEGFARVSIDGEFEIFIDARGKPIGDHMFIEASDFSNGVAEGLTRVGKRVRIDAEGRIL